MRWPVAAFLLASCAAPRSPAAREPIAEEEEDTLMPSRHGRRAAVSSAPCAADLMSCGEDGCEAAGSPHALFNHVKRRTTAADGSPVTFTSAQPIDFTVMAKLQSKADQLVGEHVMPAQNERDKLDQIDIDGVMLGEGIGARMVGYLAPHPTESAGVHPGGIESVNCRLTAEADRDVHIPLIPNKGSDECGGVVVEMIPQGRGQHPHWTAKDLVALGKTGAMVMVVGPLFYDSEHYTNSNCANLKKGQPKRMSLWELHPVTELYTCNASSCTANSIAGWVPVD